jgi:hypothetical protein
MVTSLQRWLRAGRGRTVAQQDLLALVDVARGAEAHLPLRAARAVRRHHVPPDFITCRFENTAEGLGAARSCSSSAQLWVVVDQ